MSDPATFAQPKRPPVSIEYVLVKGKVVMEKGKHTGVLAGEALKMRDYIAKQV